MGDDTREAFRSDLPACPFCGATTAAASDDSGPWEVECGSCQAYTWGETEADAVAAWCRRSVPANSGEWVAWSDASPERGRLIETATPTEVTLPRPEYYHYRRSDYGTHWRYYTPPATLPSGPVECQNLPGGCCGCCSECEAALAVGYYDG